MANIGQQFREYQPSKTALLWSCVGTAVVVLILGFTWGGWVTGGTAEEMAEEAAEEARAQLAAAVCVDRFMAAADARAQLASLKEIDSSWNRDNFIEEGDWVTIAGEQYDDAADICAEMLMEKVTCSPGAPSVDMRVRHQETDDEEEPVQRGADHRGAA